MLRIPENLHNYTQTQKTGINVPKITDIWLGIFLTVLLHRKVEILNFRFQCGWPITTDPLAIKPADKFNERLCNSDFLREFLGKMTRRSMTFSKNN